MSNQIIPIGTIEDTLSGLFKKLYDDIRNIVREEISSSQEEQKKQSASEFLNSKETAKMLRCPVGSIYQLVHQKKIPFIKKGEKKLLFKKSDIDAWIAEGKFKPYKQKSE